MILRFLGKIPVGRFEFTCVCGQYSETDHEIKQPKGLGWQFSQDFDCSSDVCDISFQVYQQTNHWHIRTWNSGHFGKVT